MGKTLLATLVCLGIMISGFAANESNVPKVIKLRPMSAESAPEWAKGIKSLFKIDTVFSAEETELLQGFLS